MRRACWEFQKRPAVRVAGGLAAGKGRWGERPASLWARAWPPSQPRRQGLYSSLPPGAGAGGGAAGAVSPAVSKPLHPKFLYAVVTEEAVESLL